MNWFNDERQRYIAELLYVVGHLKRAYLMRKFRISVAQASHDLRTFMRRNPKAMAYDKNLKAYIAAKRPKFKFGPNTVMYFHPYDRTLEKVLEATRK